MVICFFGDSLVAGTGDPACLGWAGRVVVPLVARGRAITSYNLGIRKDTSRKVAARWKAESSLRALEGWETRLVFAVGTADAAIREGRVAVPPEETIANTRTILAEAAKDHPVLFVGPPPVADDEHTRRNAELNSALGTVCAETGVPYLDTYSRLAETPAYLADVRANDGVHPRHTGYGIIADLVTAWPAWHDWFDL